MKTKLADLGMSPFLTSEDLLEQTDTSTGNIATQNLSTDKDAINLLSDMFFLSNKKCISTKARRH